MRMIIAIGIALPRIRIDYFCCWKKRNSGIDSAIKESFRITMRICCILITFIAIKDVPISIIFIGYTDVAVFY